MADNVERLILDDSDFLKGLDNVIKKSKDAKDAFEGLNDEISKNGKKSGEDFVKTNKKVNDSLKETAKKHREAIEETKKNIGNTKLFGVSLNDINAKIQAYRNGLIATLKTMTGFSKLTKTQTEGVERLTKVVGGGRLAFIAMAKGVNILKAALIASGIGAVVVVLGSLAAALTTTQTGMDKLGQATSYLGGAFDILTSKAAKLGNELINGLGNGNFWNTLLENTKKVIDTGLISSIIKLGIEMDEVGQKTAFFTKQFQKLAIEQSNADLLTAKNRSRLEAYKLIAEDTTKSFKVRVKAARDAAQVEREQLDVQLKIAAKRLYFTKRDNEERSKSGLTTNLEKENELAARLFNLKADSATKTIELQNKENALVKEYIDKLKSAQVKLRSITKEVVSVGSELSLIGEKESFDFARVEQIENLRLLKKELQDISKLTGEDVTNQIEVLDQAIEALGNRGFDKPIDRLVVPVKELQIKSESQKPLDIDLKVTILPESEKEFLEGIETFEDLFNEAIDSIFSTKNQEKAKKFLSGLSDLFNGFNSIVSESAAIEVEAIDKQLDKLSNRRELLQEALESELADREKGLANNVGDKQQEVDAIIAEELRLSTEKEKIQKEAQKRQLLIDTLTQTQSIITTSINILKGFSQIPIFGLPLGIAAVGSMLAFFAKTKADAFKATKLHTGANRINDYFGFGERHGDTDLPGRGEGYELVNRKTGKRTNTVISGREMLLPENVSISNEHFFNSLRSGAYNGIDLNDAVSFYQSYRNNPATSTTSAKVEQIRHVKGREKQGFLIPIKNKGKECYKYIVIDPNTADGSVIEIKE